MTTILIVEDDDLVLETTKELLEVSGYDVLGASNGHQALELLKAPASPIFVILLDLSLPDINGLDLLPEINELSPKSRIIICSGSISDEEVENHINQHSVQGFLQKPFNLNSLKNVIDKVLNS